MALVRYTEFTDLLDRVIRVEIHDTAFSGVATEFSSAKPGAVIASSKFGSTPTDLIKGTSCTVYFIVEDGTDKTFITGIVGAHEEQYVCVVYIDSVFEFAGYILTDLCTIEAAAYPYVVELTATEGLSRLTDVEMLDSGSLYTGKLTVLEAFIECLSKIGTQTYWPVAASDDWIHTSVDWWEDNHPARANNIDPLAYTRFDTTVFLETKQTDDGQIQIQLGDDGLPKPRKVGDVLFDLCRAWDVRLYLARGTWHIEQVNLMDGTAVPYRAYDTTGSFSDSGTFNPRKSVDCDTIKPLTDGAYTFHAPILKVTARRAHQSNYNLLSTRTLPFNTDLDETIVGTLTAGVNNTVSVSGRMWLRWAGVAGTVLFYTGVKVTIRLTDGIDDYYLDGSDWNSQNVYTAGNRRNFTAGTWQQYATSYYCWYPGMKGSANGFLYVPIDIITPDLPISGQVSVEIDFIIDKDRYLYASGYDVPGTVIYRFENLTCIYNEGTAANYSAIEVLNTTDGTTPVTDSRSIDLGDIRFGDGVNAVSLGAFEVSPDLATWVGSSQWHESTSGDSYSMLELLCREVLARQRVASRIFSTTIYGGQLCHEDVLTYDNLVWMAAAIQTDLHDDMARGEWVAIGTARDYIKQEFTSNLIAPRLDLVPSVDYSDSKTRNASFTYAGVATRGGSQLTASYDAGDTLTVLAVADLGFDLANGAKIHVVNPYTGEYQTFTTDDAYVSGGTEIPVDTTAEIDLPVGSFVVVDVSAVMANAGGPELWTRTLTVLSPTTSGDSISIGASSVTTPAIYSANATGIAISGVGVIGVAGQADGANNIAGVFTNIGGGLACSDTVNASSTNSVLAVYRISRNCIGTAQNGIGARIEYYIEATDTTSYDAGSLDIKYTDATYTSRVSQFELRLINSGAIARKLAVAGSGQLTLDAYGDGTFTGTKTTTPHFTADGIVVEQEYGEFDDLKVGGATDYLNVDSVGHLTLLGKARVYKDMLNELVGKRITSASSAIEIDDEEIRLEFKISCELTDYVSMNIQLNHERCLGTNVYPHLHWEQSSATMPNWLLQYRWQIQGAAKTTAWTYLPWVSNAFAWTTGTLNQITLFGTITPPSGDGHSDILQFRIIRDFDNDSSEFEAEDGLNASAYALMFDVHVVVDKLGSASEFTDTEETVSTTTT
jgi:hypothetical protein